jgi:Fe-S cluster biogenesis protein NfuA/nitrite reductase/ring-hydroxylating ferredoxin subunit
MPGHPELEGVERIDELVLKLETGADADVRDTAKELLQALMAFHGAGLERLLSLVRDGGGGQATLDQFARDELVRSLLLLYGLHPVDVETRVLEALEKTRPYLRSHGGNVELVGVEADGTVRLRMQGSCHGCPSSAVTLKLAIEQAIRDAAPDVTEIVVVDNSAPHATSPLPLVELQSAGHTNGNGDGHDLENVVWEAVPDIRRLTEGSAHLLTVKGREVLFCRLDENFYAYADRCPACGGSLAAARLVGRALSCGTCAGSFDVVQAGRGLDRSDLHLDPFPLLFEHGHARVAIPPARSGMAAAGAAAGTR